MKLFLFPRHRQMQIFAECYPSSCQNKDATDNNLRAETPCHLLWKTLFFLNVFT